MAEVKLFGNGTFVGVAKHAIIVSSYGANENYDNDEKHSWYQIINYQDTILVNEYNFVPGYVHQDVDTICIDDTRYVLRGGLGYRDDGLFGVIDKEYTKVRKDN